MYVCMYVCDAGPSLSMINSSTKPKGKLKDIIFEAFEAGQKKGPLAVSDMVVQRPVRHPGCTHSKLPGFVLKIC